MDFTRVKYFFPLRKFLRSSFRFCTKWIFISPPRFVGLGTPLLLSAITYIGVTMLMRIPRASSHGYLQPRIFPITLNAVAINAHFRVSASLPVAAFIRVFIDFAPRTHIDKCPVNFVHPIIFSRMHFYTPIR